jgi:molybdate/tungstate transport system substrate-binding protein
MKMTALVGALTATLPGAACRILRIAAMLIVCAACGGERGGAGAGDDVLTVYNAGSLARPLRTALDSFAARTGTRIEQESAGSLETARKLTELHKIPDIVALADYKVFPELLMPGHVTWYAAFARNRMVLAHTPRSRFANEINGTNWWEILLRPGVETGRSDPNLDPNGYRTLLVFQLAERHHRRPGLAGELLASAPPRNVRPKEVDLVALLQAGELDYIWSYESVARATSLPFVRLPDEVDLGSPTHAESYALAEVRITGATRGDSITLRGEPIVYALSIPTAAPHRALAERAVAFLLSSDGVRIMRAASLDVLDRPLVTGANVPAVVDSVRNR